MVVSQQSNETFTITSVLKHSHWSQKKGLLHFNPSFTEGKKKRSQKAVYSDYKAVFVLKPHSERQEDKASPPWLHWDLDPCYAECSSTLKRGQCHGVTWISSEVYLPYSRSCTFCLNWIFPTLGMLWGMQLSCQPWEGSTHWWLCLKLITLSPQWHICFILSFSSISMWIKALTKIMLPNIIMNTSHTEEAKGQMKTLSYLQA